MAATAVEIERAQAERPLALRASRGVLPTAPLRAGAAALGRWADAQRAALEVVAQRRDADGPMVDRALELVRQFIIARGLILFGGLAIDYALRLKGASIYPDDERPDFDFLSPRSVDDAYDLADLLHRAGFEGVGAVRGIHVQTMRVRTNFVWVADIGYTPASVFDRIPTLEYRGMRIAHPDYQRMDIHLAFCFPFNGPPLEDVFHRWRKDLKRFNLVSAHYPIAPPRGVGDGGLGAAQLVTARLGAPVAGRGGDLVVALHGFAAYAATRAALDELCAAIGAPCEVRAPRLRLAFPDSQSLTVELPAGSTVVVASPEPAAVIEGLTPRAEWSAPYLDINPEAVRAGALTVLSTRGRLLAASLIRVSITAGAGSESAQAYVVTPQYLLLYFLFEAHRAQGPDRDVYLAFYAHTLEILQAAEAVFAGLIDDRAATRAAVMATFAESPFAPSTRTIGSVNNSSAYVIKMAANAEKLRDVPPAALHLDADIASILSGLPQNYYPNTAKQRPTFDYGRNPLFRRDGGPLPASSHVGEAPL